MHPWYAIRVRARSEARVRTALQLKEIKELEVFLPTHKEVKQYSDRIKTVDAPLFPGYIFCRCDITKRLPILTTPGVDYILGTNGEPEPLPEKEITSILSVVNAGANVRPWAFLKSGDRVRVEFGSFKGVEGFILNEKGVDRLILSVTILKRSVSVDIDRAWVKPL